jgi:hypothetical protein
MTITLEHIRGVHFTDPGLKKAPPANDRAIAKLPEMDASFSSILIKAKRVAGHDDAEDSPSSSPPKEELLRFLQEKQTEMNLRLLRSLSENAEDYGSSTDPMRVLAYGLLASPEGVEASKYGQQALKSDGPLSLPDLDPIIRHASDTYGIDQGLIKAVIKVESNFQASSTSPKGAMGLMQLMPATAHDMGVKDPYDPFQNIMAGTRYLRGLVDRYQGNIPQALAAYNWGPGNAEKYPERLPRETRDYVKRVGQQYQAAKASA